MEEDISVSVMEQTLKEAGIEDSLSKDELRNVYEVIRNSRSTAEQDQSLRQIADVEQPEDDIIEESITEVEVHPVKPKEVPFKPKSFKVYEPPVDNVELFDHEDTVGNIKSNTSMANALEVIFGFDDMPESTEDNYKLISHELKNVSIYNNPTFLKANYQSKAKILHSYSTKISKIKTQFCKRLFTFAPLSDPIKFSYIATSEEFEQDNTYISRSGRQTKKRNYCYDEDIVEATSPKKTKSQDEDESDWLSKSASKFENKGKRTIRKVANNNESAEQNHNSSEAENVASGSEARKSLKFTNLKRLNNEEIMNRSSLFQDSPTSSFSPKSTRSELIMSKALEEDQKKQKEEEEKEKFYRTLEQSERETEIADNYEIIDVDNAASIRKRRVVPTIPGRKPINNRTKKGNSDYPPLDKKRNVKKVDVLIESQPSTSQDNDCQSCPICAKSFPVTEIEEHAWTCGNTEEPSASTSKKTSRISCPYCDKVISVTTDYDTHVTACKKNCVCCDICDKLFPQKNFEAHKAVCKRNPQQNRI